MQTTIPARAGTRPRTTPSNPHTQLEQIAPVEVQDALAAHALSLPGVRPGPSQVSVPGSVAFYLDEPINPPTMPALFVGEWGHIHPHYDGSLHLNLPQEVADPLVEAGWVEYHSLVALGMLPPLVVMLYGPRDQAELRIAKAIVEESYLRNGGATTDSAGRVLGVAGLDTTRSSDAGSTP